MLWWEIAEHEMTPLSHHIGDEDVSADGDVHHGDGDDGVGGDGDDGDVDHVYDSDDGDVGDERWIWCVDLVLSLSPLSLKLFSMVHLYLSLPGALLQTYTGTVLHTV